LKQQISFCVANLKCCTLGKSKSLCHSECHSKVILCQTVQCKTKTQQAGTSHKSITIAVDISSGKLTLLAVNTSARCKLTTLLFHKLQTLVKQRRRPLKSTECRCKMSSSGPDRMQNMHIRCWWCQWCSPRNLNIKIRCLISIFKMKWRCRFITNTEGCIFWGTDLADNVRN